MKPLYAILMDGAFVIRRLGVRLGRPPTPDEVYGEALRLQALPAVSSYELLRVYFYDSLPPSETLVRPVSKAPYDLTDTDRYREAKAMHDALSLKPNVAVRTGEAMLCQPNWRLRSNRMTQLIRDARPLTDDDFQPDIVQKGVDMRIGMDLAQLALRDLVRAVVVATGDSDFVPAFKFVRREGVRVILDPMSQNVRVELRRHADLVVDDVPKPPKCEAAAPPVQAAAAGGQASVRQAPAPAAAPTKPQPAQPAPKAPQPAKKPTQQAQKPQPQPKKQAKPAPKAQQPQAKTQGSPQQTQAKPKAEPVSAATQPKPAVKPNPANAPKAPTPV